MGGAPPPTLHQCPLARVALHFIQRMLTCAILMMLNTSTRCIVSSPLILAYNLSEPSRRALVWDIITNKEAIAVNQAWDGKLNVFFYLYIKNTHRNLVDSRSMIGCHVPPVTGFTAPLPVPSQSCSLLSILC